MSQIAKFSYLKKLLPNTILVKQGECAKGIYIIHTGQVKLIRKTEQNTRILTLGELVKSDVCCDASFLKNEPCHYTAICILPLIAYYIDKDDLKKIDKNTVNDLSKLCKKFPSDAELQQDYSDKKK